jgi:putative aldouronate transport system substrate-binding protein
MRLKKSLAVLVALSMLLASIAGCATTGSTATTAPSASASGQTATVAPTEAPTAPPSNDMTKFDPPITITTAMAIRPADVLRPGDTADDNPLSRWMKDNLGIIITHKWTVADADNAYKTRIQLALSSGEEMPDVFYTGYDDLFANLIESGKIQSIDDSFNKYATERVKFA